jgi:hypothetical protein
MSIEQTRRNGKTNRKWKVRDYLPKAPQRAHGETVAQVVALWQGLVHVEGHDWPTNRKPLVALELKKERTTEKDRLRRTTLRHPRAQPCMRSQEHSCPNWCGARRPRARRRSSEYRGSSTSSLRHPANCRTTRTQTATTGTPRRTYRLSPARRHLLCNQPAQTKSHVSFIVSI